MEIGRREDIDHDSKALRASAYAISFWNDATQDKSVFAGSLLEKMLRLFCLLCDEGM